MGGWIYSLKEAWIGFSKARVATAVTVFAIFFLSSVLSFFVLLSMNIDRFVQVLKERQDIQVFISNAAVEKAIAELKARIASYEQVESVQYISKEDAAREFKSVFGEDIFNLLEENPLPASLLIRVKRNFSSEAEIRRLIARLQAERQVDEVIYQRGAADKLVKFSRLSQRILLGVFALVFLGSLFMVSNTIRLIILGRRPIIDTMKLVGATNSFIKRPFLFEGLLQGAAGGTAAALFLWLSWRFIEWRWPGVVYIPRELPAAVLVAGLLFGYLGSRIAVRRYL